MPDYVLYQIHFNADYSKVTCGWMLDWMLMVSVNPAYDYHHEEALTQYQCICYALDKPGVLTVLPGAQSIQKIEYLLKYEEQPESTLDYSVIGSFAPPEASGKCVYCNHCQPCPAGIDIGVVNKFYDLAKIGVDMAREHYRALEKNAADCMGCGHCNRRCPFSVAQMERMQEIKEYFDNGTV